MTEKNKIKKIEAKVYDQKGNEVGSVELPHQVFGQKWNSDLVHEVVSSMLSNARQPIAHAKTRGEVRGGGKKPWKQKGLGRARHGSSRSPIWVGGGVTHGPRNDKNYSKKINKKAKTKALYTILSKKFNEGEVLFIDSLSFSSPKTKEAKNILKSWSSIGGFERVLSKGKNATLLNIATRDSNVLKSFRNFSNMTVEEFRNINPVSALKAKYLIIENPKSVLAKFSVK